MAINKGDIQPIVAGVRSTEAKLTAVNEVVQNSVTSMQMDQSVQAVTQAVSGLGDGLDLVAKQQQQIEQESNNMGAWWQEKIAEFINNQTTTLQAVQENGSNEMQIVDAIEAGVENDTIMAETEKTTKPEIAVNASIAAPTDLGASINMPTLIANGYSLLYNALGTMTGSLIDALSPLAQIAMAMNNQVTTTEQLHTDNVQKKEKEDADGGGGAKNRLGQYLAEMAGPLNSIASGLLVLTVSVLALSILPGVAGAAFTGVVAFASLMIMTFAALSMVATAYMENFYGTLDTDTQDQPGNLYGIVKRFAIMVGLMLGTFMLVMVTVEILRANVDNLFMGLIMTISIMIGSMFMLNLLCQNNQDQFSDSAPMPILLKSFAIMVALIAGVMLLCAFTWPLMLSGSLAAILILGCAALMIWALSEIMKQTFEKVSAEKMEAFKGILITVIVLVAVIAILAIVLGLLPTSVVIQGIIAVGLITVMIDVMLFMVGKQIKAMQEVPQDKIDALLGIMITLCVLITIMGVLVYVLGGMPIAELLQGIIAVALLIAIPILAMKLLSKVQVDPQIFITIVMIGIMVLLIGATGAIVATIFQKIPGGANAVLVSSIALLIVVVAFVILGYASPMLATAATVLMSPGPFFGMPNLVGALIGLGLITVFVLAIAAVAVAVTYIFLSVPGGPENVMKSAIGLFYTAMSFAVIAPLSVILAGMFWFLFWSVGLSVASLWLLVTFARAIAWAAKQLAGFQIDPEMLEPAKKAMIKFGKMVQDMTPIVKQLAKIMIPFTIYMTIVAYTTLRSVISLTLFNFGLWLIAALKVPVDQFKNNLDGLKQAVIYMGGMADAVRAYVGVPAWRWWGLIWDLYYMEQAAKRMAKIGAAGDASNINLMADSLEKLANTSNGLQNVARAMREVASAAAELNTVKDINMTHSVEHLAGVNVQNILSLKEMFKPAEKKDDKKLAKVESTLSNIESAISRLVSLMEAGNGIAEDSNTKFNQMSARSATASS